MELAGIEPASESPFIAVSPITVGPLCVAYHTVPSIKRRQTGSWLW